MDELLLCTQVVAGSNPVASTTSMASSSMKLQDLDLHAFGDTIQIAGMLYHDGPNDRFFVLPFPEQEPLGPYWFEDTTVLEMDLDEWTRFVHQSDRVEVMASVVDQHGNLGKAFVLKSARQIAQNVSWAVYRRDNYRCSYCGADSVPLTVDHLVLWEEGGPSIPENLCLPARNATRGGGILRTPTGL